MGTKIKDIINSILLPLKLVIPQPIVAQIPGLSTNEDIRLGKVLSLIPMQSQVLDIGCGTNRLMGMHRARGGRGVGVDVYPWEDVDLVVQDSSKLPFAEKSFDCITFVASLNHIPNRVEVLRQAYKLLTDDGMILITSLDPCLSTFWHRWAFWDRDQRERGMKAGEVYGFTDGELQQFLASAGFKLKHKYGFSWGLNKLYVGMKGSNE